MKSTRRVQGLLNPADLRRDAGNRLLVRHRAETGGRRRVPAERRRQTIGVGALKVPLHTFRAEHPSVERKLLPRLESDHFVPANLELDATLLPTETAVGLDEALRLH